MNNVKTGEIEKNLAKASDDVPRDSSGSEDQPSTVTDIDAFMEDTDIQLCNSESAPRYRYSEDDTSNLEISFVSEKMAEILYKHHSPPNDLADPAEHDEFDRACALLRRHSYDDAADYLEAAVVELES